jgi:hypothetical protein
MYQKDKNSNMMIKIKLDKNDKEQLEFINMLSNIDNYIKYYITRFSKEIENEFFKEIIICNNRKVALQRLDRTLFNTSNYEPILKHYGNLDNSVNEIIMRSYLEPENNAKLSQSQLLNNRYILTFNISNIYISNNNLYPLLKCNKLSILE